METGRPPSPHTRAAPFRCHAGPGRAADPGSATPVATGAGLRADRSRSGCARATCRRTAQGSRVRTRTATNPKPAPHQLHQILGGRVRLIDQVDLRVADLAE